MSEVIRDAIIRLRLEMQRGKLEAGDVAAVARKYTELHQAAKESQQAVHDNIGAARQYASAAREANSAATGWAAGLKKLNAEWRQQGSGRNSWGEGMQRMQTQASAGKFKEIQLSERLAAVRRRNAEEERAALESAQASAEKAARAHQAFGIHAARAFKDGLEGSIQLARGIALMSASGEEDTRKLLEQFAKIEAATALIRGAVNLGKFAVAFGPVGQAVAVVTTVVTAGVTVWKLWGNAAAAAAREAGEAAKRFREQSSAMQEIENRQRAAETRTALGALGMGVDDALSPGERYNRTRVAVAEAARMEAEAKKQVDQTRRLYARAIGVDTAPLGVQDIEISKRSPAAGKNIMGLEDRRRTILGAERQLIKDKYALEREMYEEHLRGASVARQEAVTAAISGTFGVPGLAGFAAAGAQATVSGTTSAIERGLAEATNKAQAGLNRIAEAIDAISRRIDATQKQLDGANPR